MAVDIDGIDVHIPSLANLISNKCASRRTKDLADAEALEKIWSEPLKLDTMELKLLSASEPT